MPVLLALQCMLLLWISVEVIGADIFGESLLKSDPKSTTSSVKVVVDTVVVIVVGAAHWIAGSCELEPA